MSLTGDPSGEPYRAGIAVFDVMAGMHATIGILAALNHRNETGRGQHIEISLLASAMSGLVNQASAYVAGGVVPFRMGNSHPSLFPYEPLPCADGELIITAGNHDHALIEPWLVRRGEEQPPPPLEVEQLLDPAEERAPPSVAEARATGASRHAQ